MSVIAYASAVTLLCTTGTITGPKTFFESGGRKLFIDRGRFHKATLVRQRDWQAVPINATARQSVRPVGLIMASAVARDARILRHLNAWLVDWVGVDRTHLPKTTFITYGEPEAAQGTAERIESIQGQVAGKPGDCSRHELV